MALGASSLAGGHECAETVEIQNRSGAKCVGGSHLFGGGPWRPDADTISALHTKFVEIGLEETIPGRPDDWRSTALGKALSIDLLFVFLGMWWEWEVPLILGDHGLISEDEAAKVYKRLGRGDHYEAVLPDYVRRAFFAWRLLDRRARRLFPFTALPHSRPTTATP
jgi:hypothetical protein